MTKFTKDHEYIADDGTVGITPYAQDQLGDIVFVELPKVGQKLKQGDEAAVVESVKAASEIYAPVSGTVTAVNDAVVTSPGLVNEDPQGQGWMFKLTLDNPAELDGLMDAAAYAELTK
jgi:glycine cleavage system H protein